MTTFEELGVLTCLANCCRKYGWNLPLPIQISAIGPAILGKDIIGSSETGSGKTGAFLLPIIQRWLLAKKPKGYALILAPTRELACQINETANKLMAYFEYSPEDVQLNVFQLIGGENSVDQAISLAWCQHHFIVATPGRLLEHMKQSKGFAEHHLSSIKQLVLDEADRMLSMEFADDIDALLNIFERPVSLLAPTKHPNRSKNRQSYLSRMQEEENLKNKDKTYHHKGLRYPHPQTFLFTATMTKDVRKLRRVALNRDAVLCTSISSSAGDIIMKPGERNCVDNCLPEGLSHFCLPVRRNDKLAILDWLVESSLNQATVEKDFRIIVFCARCHETRFLSGVLNQRGYNAVGLTGRMKQPDRKRVLLEFVEGRAKVLVATDVASRGLDLPFVAMVINYGVPLTSKTYRHRVGRTARAGQLGTAVTIVTRDDGAAYLELENEILQTKPNETRKSLPRWPHPVPSEQEFCTRRRVTEEAWSRASKNIRSESELRAKKARDVSSESEAGDELAPGSDMEQDAGRISANQHWASGAAGIEAARQAHAVAAKIKKTKRASALLDEIDDVDLDEETIGNLKFNQPIKNSRIAVTACKNKLAVAKKTRLQKFV